MTAASAGAEPRGRWAFGLTVAAFAWCLAVVVAAFVAPVYSSGSTLAQENGAWVGLPIAAPAALTLVAWIGLKRRCTQASETGTRLAWLSVALVAGYALLAAASIGLFVLPAAALLAAAARLTPRAARRELA